MKSATKFPWLYLLLAYGWAWLWWIPVALSRIDYQTSPLLVSVVLIGVFGPGLAGIFLTYHSVVPEERHDFWRRAFDIRRVQWRWIIFMLLLWPAMHILANVSSAALGSPPPASEMVAQIAAQPPFGLIVVVLYFLQAALEDLGWRGYLQQHLLRSYTPIGSALIVGIFHAFWHLPLFLVAGTNQAQMGLGLNFWLFVAQAVAFSFYATWCYIDNRYSTLAAILLHTVGNLCNDIFTLQGGTLKFQLHTLFMVVGALAIGLIWLRRRALPQMGIELQEAS